jgi:hypothetical protein
MDAQHADRGIKSDYDMLYVFVEGQTEFEVVKHFLQPYWQQRFKKCAVLNFKGNGNLKVRYVAEIKRVLAQPDHAALLLIDVKEDPFGLHMQSTSSTEAYHHLRKRMYGGLGMTESDRIGIFPVVVEPETWLIADPTIQNEYLPQAYDHPENETDPAAVIKKYITGYRKGVGARKFFEKASAVQVYKDNCPHFVLLVDWITGKSLPAEPSPATELSLDRQQKIAQLQSKYDSLTEQIETSLKRGQTAGAGVLKAERSSLELQMRDLSLGR